MLKEYRFDVIVRVEEDDYKRVATMEIYDVEDIDPVRLPIAEESVPYFKGMDLGRLGWRAWDCIAIPPVPMPEIDDLIKIQEESNA
jgi:hypothetical protein